MLIYLTQGPTGYYIGMHRNVTLGSYLGSGLRLTRSIRKYGREAHKAYVLQTCSSEEELREAERNWIKSLRGPRCLNILDGGQGIDRERSKELQQLQADMIAFGQDIYQAQKKHCLTNLAYSHKRLAAVRMSEKIKARARRMSSDPNHQKHANKQRWSNPDQRKNQSERIKAYYADPERRKWKSEQMKAYHAKRRLDLGNVTS